MNLNLLLVSFLLLLLARYAMKWRYATLVAFISASSILVVPLDNTKIPQLALFALLLISVTIGWPALHPPRSSKDRRTYRRSMFQPLLWCLTIIVLCSSVQVEPLLLLGLCISVLLWAPVYLALRQASKKDWETLSTAIIVLSVCIASIAAIVGLTGNHALHDFFFLPKKEIAGGDPRHLTLDRLVMPGTWTIAPLGFLLAVQKLLSGKKLLRHQFLFWFAAAVLIETGVAFSYTRSILIAHTLGIIIILVLAHFMLPRNQSRRVGAMVIGLALFLPLLFAVAPQILLKWNSRIQDTRAAGTSIDREKSSLRMYSALSTNVQLISPVTKELPKLDDPFVLLVAWAKYGLLGAGLFVIILMWCFGTTILAFATWKAKPVEVREHIVVLAGLWILTIINFFGGISFENMQVFILIWLFREVEFCYLGGFEILSVPGKEPQLHQLVSISAIVD